MAGAEPIFPLVARRRLIGLAFGSSPSVRRGTGSDVAGSRAYRPGDTVWAIDWYASARASSARGSDEFVVRERHAEEAPRAVVVCDRRPAMALYPPEFPWLSKPAAIVAAGEVIAESAIAARGLIGYLDFANVAHPDPAHRREPFWRPPGGRYELRRMKDERLPHGSFHAPDDNVTLALDYLGQHRRAVPPGTFVFILSDFLVSPPFEAWLAARERRWELVPVVIQDPIWEQSFPALDSIVCPLADGESGRLRLVRLTRGEVEERRRANEARLAELLAGFVSLAIEPVVLSTHDREDVLSAFLAWADLRVHGDRRGW